MLKEKQQLIVEAAMVDATKAAEDTLSHYESVQLRCAVLFQSHESRALMSRHPIDISSACVINTSQDCRCGVVNGSKVISAADFAEGPAALLVNGSLRVEPGAGDALRSYEAVVVNGTLLCPETLRAATRNVTVNGQTRFYPEQAILIDDSAEIDAAFIQRAKPDQLYYLTGTARMVEKDLNLAVLKEKKVRIQAQRAVVRSSCLERAAEILTENTPLMIMPDDCSYVMKEAALDSLIARYGEKLFLHCDLALDEGDRPALAALSCLEVHGHVTLPKSLESCFYQKCKKFDSIEVYDPCGAPCISDIPEVTVTAQMLEAFPNGICIRDCAQVRIAEEIQPPQLQRILSIQDCARIVCTEEQRAILLPICHDVGLVSSEGGQSTPGNTQHVRCVSYTL